MGSFTQNSTSYTSVSGSRSTSNVGSSAAMRDVQKAMVTFQPYQTPLLVKLLSEKFGKKPTGNQTFEWSQSTLLPQTASITLVGGSATETVVAANLGDITLFQLGTVIFVEANSEVLVCTTVTSTTSIVLTKIGSGTITAITGKTYRFLGDSFEQGTSSATAKSVNKVFNKNYVEIFKKSVHINRSQMATVEYGDEDKMRNKRDRMQEWKIQMEASLLFGKGLLKATGVQVGTNSQGFTGGIFNGYYDGSSNYKYINTVDTTATGSFNETYFFQTFLKNGFDKGSPNKRFYVGGGLKGLISAFARTKILAKSGDSEYGVDIVNIDHDFGTLEVVRHPMLNTAMTTNWGMLLDQGSNYLSYRYLAGNGISRDLQFEEFGYLQEADQYKGQWIAECGWQIEGDDYHTIYQPAS